MAFRVGKSARQLLIKASVSDFLFLTKKSRQAIIGRRLTTKKYRLDLKAPKGENWE